jgi:hypothetical protein
MVLLITKYCSSDHITKNEIWWGIGTYVRQEDNAGSSWGDLTKRVHMDDLGVDRRIILKSISRSGMRRRMVWVDLIRDTDRRRALVNAVMNIRLS